eukprot:3726189-Amphidinium_carterae.1
MSQSYMRSALLYTVNMPSAGCINSSCKGAVKATNCIKKRHILLYNQEFGSGFLAPAQACESSIAIYAS